MTGTESKCCVVYSTALVNWTNSYSLRLTQIIHWVVDGTFCASRPIFTCHPSCWSTRIVLLTLAHHHYMYTHTWHVVSGHIWSSDLLVDMHTCIYMYMYCILLLYCWVRMAAVFLISVAKQREVHSKDSSWWLKVLILHKCPPPQDSLHHVLSPMDAAGPPCPKVSMCDGCARPDAGYISVHASLLHRETSLCAVCVGVYSSSYCIMW